MHSIYAWVVVIILMRLFEITMYYDENVLKIVKDRSMDCEGYTVGGSLTEKFHQERHEFTYILPKVMRWH